MTTQTLERPQVVSKSIRRRSASFAPAPAARSAPAPKKLSAAKLQEVEDRLLAATVAHHPNGDRALDRLLDDLERLPLDHPHRQLTPLRRHSQLERMDELLMHAVVESHPDRPVAIERLLADVVADAAMDDDEHLDRLRFDMQVDNDFDGLS